MPDTLDTPRAREIRARRLAHLYLGRPWRDLAEYERDACRNHHDKRSSPDDIADQLDTERRDHALTRHLLGFAMLALARIEDGAPRSDPEEIADHDYPDSYEGIEALGYSFARWNDAGTARLARSQIAWLRRAARKAQSPDDIRALAVALRFNGFYAEPETVASAVLSAREPIAAAYTYRHPWGN